MTACSRCGTPAPNGEARFCAQCGTPLALSDTPAPASDGTAPAGAAPDGTQWSTEVGWHVDPENPAQERYWNGWRWTQIRLREGEPPAVEVSRPKARSWRTVIAIGVAIAAVGIIWPMLTRNGAPTTLVSTATQAAAPTETVCAGARALVVEVDSLIGGGPATVESVRRGAGVLAGTTAGDQLVTAVVRDVAEAASTLADAMSTSTDLESATAGFEDARQQLELYCAP